MKPNIITLAFIMLIGLQGCAGTGETRIKNSGNWAGAYPGQAIASDFELIVNPPQSVPIPRYFFVVAAILSFPVDIVADTVLLPVDLALWPFDFKK